MKRRLGKKGNINNRDLYFIENIQSAYQDTRFLTNKNLVILKSKMRSQSVNSYQDIVSKFSRILMYLELYMEDTNKVLSIEEKEKLHIIILKLKNFIK